MTPKPVSETELRQWGSCLLNPSATLVDRSRALWGLRHAAEPLALELLADFVCNYVKPSPIANDLLQHEAAYCLGQRGNPEAIPYLLEAIRNDKHVVLIRHEAAEALAALSGCDGVNIDEIEKSLKEFANSSITELAETCQVGLKRIEWIKSKKTKHEASQSPCDLAVQFFPNTIDPAPSFTTDENYTDEQLRDLLMDPSKDLFTRFRAMFTLRDHVLQAIMDKTSPEKPASLLAEGLTAPGSALLRHEVAFVLGQLTVACTVPPLSTCVRQINEHPMVRHEAAEALGSILGELEGKFLTSNVKSSVPKEYENQARDVLKEFTKDKEPVVRESCVLALDVADYIASPEQFQYAAVPQN